MFDATALITYAVIVAGFSALPGPAVLLTLARSASSGTRTGVATSLGIAIGDLLHTALAVLGVSAILMASAVAFTIMKSCPILPKQSHCVRRDWLFNSVAYRQIFLRFQVLKTGKG